MTSRARFHHRQPTYRRGGLVVGLTLALGSLGSATATANGVASALQPRPDSPLAIAVAAMAAGDPEVTLDTLDGYQGAGKALATHLQAQANWKLGRRKAAVKLWEGMRLPTGCRASGPHPLATRMRVARASLLADKDPVAAAEQLLALPSDAGHLAAAVELLTEGKVTKRADNAVGRLLIEFPAAKETLDAARGLGPDGVQAHLVSIRRRLARLRNLVKANANDKAAREAKALLADLPAKHPSRCEVTYLQGRTARKRRRYDEAVSTLRQARKTCVGKDPSSVDFLLRSTLLLTQVHAILGDLDELKSLVRWMGKHHRKHRFTDDARFLYAEALDRKGRWRQAKKQYDLVAETPGADHAITAAWRVAWRAIRDGRTRDAAKRLGRILRKPADRPEEHLRAEYWLARLDEKRAPARATDRYLRLTRRPSFYGWLALDRLRTFRPKAAKAAESSLLAAATSTVTPPIPARVTKLDAFRSAKAYAQAGEAKLAAWSLTRINCEATDPDAALSVAIALEAVGAFADAQNQIRRRTSLLSGPLRAQNAARWRAAYSRPFKTEIATAAKAAKLDELLMTAIVREESKFDPEVVSWAGATGLAQLMGPTASAAHEQVYDKPLDLDRLTEPGLNVRLGAHVLGQGLRSFRNPIVAIGAYNGGYGLLRRSLSRKKEPLERWIEDFGVRETRRYMKRVTETWGVYRLLYDSEKPFLDLPTSVARRR